MPVEATPTPGSITTSDVGDTSAGGVAQATPTTTTASGSIWGSKTVREDSGKCNYL